MPNRPELPTFYRHRDAVLNVLPDEKPMTWSLWDLEGWLGDIMLRQPDWFSHGRTDSPEYGPYAQWEDAAAGLLDNRRDEAN